MEMNILKVFGNVSDLFMLSKLRSKLDELFMHLRYVFFSQTLVNFI